MSAKFKLVYGCYIKRPNDKLIPFDLLVNEGHSLETELSEHPVDSAGTLAVHIHNRLRQGTMDVLISNWSVNEAGKMDYYADDPEKTIKAASPQETNRAKDTFEQLKEVWANKEVVDIVMSLDVYKSVVLTNIQARRSRESGEAQGFQITFKEVKLVTLKKTKLLIGVSSADTNADPENRQAAPSVDMGNQ